MKNPNQEERVTISGDQANKTRNAHVDEEQIRRTSNYMRHSWQGRSLFAVMRVLLVVEGIIWSLMDMTRALRMRVAAKISNNKYNDRV